MKQKNQFKTPKFIRGIDPEAYREAMSIAALKEQTIGQYVTEALAGFNYDQSRLLSLAKKR